MSSNKDLQKMVATQLLRVPASRKPLFKLIVNGSVNTTGFSAQAVTQTPPAAQVLSTGGLRAAKFFFAGVGAAGNTINYRLTAWFPIEPGALKGEWTLLPMVVASGQLDLGTLICTTIVASGKVVDTITDDVNRQGTIIWTPANDTPASIIVDCQNALLLQVETDLGTSATKAFVWGAAIDPPLPKLA